MFIPVLVLAGIAASFAGPASAAEPTRAELEERVKRLEQIIEEKGLDQKGAVPDASLDDPVLNKSEVDALVEDKLKKQKVLAGWQDGFLLQSPGGDFKLKLRGYLQVQSRNFPLHDSKTNFSQFSLGFSTASIFTITTVNFQENSMSNLSHDIRRFNRFELKYLITLQQAELFKSALRAYLIADEHGSGSGRYSLTSLYYDSPDFRCFWETVDGLKFRRKLRMRRYETVGPLTEDTPVFVEIKQRLDRVTQKRRAVLFYGDALRFCNERQFPEKYAPDDEGTLKEIHTFVWQYDLRPACIVRYDRQAFMGTEYDLGLRVTFDCRLLVACCFATFGPLCAPREPKPPGSSQQIWATGTCAQTIPFATSPTKGS